MEKIASLKGLKETKADRSTRLAKMRKFEPLKDHMKHQLKDQKDGQYDSCKKSNETADESELRPEKPTKYVKLSAIKQSPHM